MSFDLLTPPQTPPAIVGIYPGVPMENYHAWDAASNSRLSQLLRSPAHLRAYLDTPKADTKATRIGRAVHTSILEPDLFDATFTTAGKCTAVTGKNEPCSNEGIAFHLGEGWLCGVHKRKHAPTDFDDSRVVLAASELARCLGIRQSVLAHPAAAGLIRASTERELSLLWTDKATGVGCKGRLDLLSPSLPGGAIVDIKSTDDARKEAFERKIFNFGYHRQAGMYLDGGGTLGIEAQNYVFIAVEKDPPYAVAVWRLSEGAVDSGRIDTQRALRRYAECLRTNQWPAYTETIEDIHLPAYGYKFEMEAVE